jgi:hypothetical protein
MTKKEEGRRKKMNNKENQKPKQNKTKDDMHACNMMECNKSKKNSKGV